MSHTLNVGILAHVDAGKTTLTERLLFAAGVLDRPGSVDAGTTQTDSLALERQRGITIRSAVASFTIDDLVVNLIDTPGHPDFIAEVERVLDVLDAVVLVVSAVEGVQPQTRILWRAVKRMALQTVFFINKMDRRGADSAATMRAIAQRLGAIDEPTVVGSALTGQGVDELMRELARVPVTAADPDAPLHARVFKIERDARGSRIAYARVVQGTIRLREWLQFDERRGGKVTRLEVFAGAPAHPAASATAGHVAKLWGLEQVRVGDRIGMVDQPGAAYRFPRPTLEALVTPEVSADGGRLRAALLQLSEQDPLIDVRQDARTNELSVSLYGEVQRQVLQATLADDYGVAVQFAPATPLYVERPAGAGEWAEVLHAPTNPYSATLGIRVEPAAPGSGVSVRIGAIDHSDVPLIVFKRFELFAAAMTGFVTEALAEGLRGWPVTDCLVTVTRCGYSIADGPPSRRGPLSTSADFRKLTPIVLLHALERAGTIVCEPAVQAVLEVPEPAGAAVIAALGRLAATVGETVAAGDLLSINALMPATVAQRLREWLPGLAGGEGVMETSYAGHVPVHGTQPSRPRSSADPRNLAEYVRAAGR